MKKLKKISSEELFFSPIDCKVADVRYGNIPITEVEIDVVFPAGFIKIDEDGRAVELISEN
jgi:hypothetical protein